MWSEIFRHRLLDALIQISTQTLQVFYRIYQVNQRIKCMHSNNLEKTGKVETKQTHGILVTG